MRSGGIKPSVSSVEHSARKADHIRIALEEDVGFGGLTTGLERVRFVHQALPEIDLEEVDVRTTILGYRVAAPLLISCMTGGLERGAIINRRLAIAAQRAGVVLGLGSGRAALDDARLADTFRVRDLAPDVPLLANIGASQLAEPDALERCERLVAMTEADALVIHANPLQEALQPEGTTGFRGILERIAEVVSSLAVPVIVKEVGWGISEDVARRLAATDVTGIDVAGAGGTSWSEVERHRIADPVMREVAASFRDWGIPTLETIVACRRGFGDGLVIASGGLRSGVDAAKCIALGADAAGLAAPMLRAAVEGRNAVSDALRRLIAEIRISMFCIGARTLDELRGTRHIAIQGRTS